METIDDFKKAKLKFVAGDKALRGLIKDEMTQEMADSVNYVNSNLEALDFKVASFAYRKNTGVKPEFEGVIEVELQGVALLIFQRATDVCWDIDQTGPDVSGNVVVWRPHLPVVKTEMPEAKPDSAFKVLGVDTEETYIELHEFVTDNNLKLQGETVSQCIIRELAEKHNIDARTDKEKCIDNALAVTGFSNSATAKQLICVMYDKGLLKTEIKQ